MLQGARHEDGIVEEGDSDGDESVVTTLPREPEDDPITDAQQAWQVLREASCIVGMHPDQVRLWCSLWVSQGFENSNCFLMDQTFFCEPLISQEC